MARGRDRVRFLHNLTSNDVKKLQPGGGCYAFLLSPQGRIQADLNLFCMEDHLLLDTEPELREKIPAHLRRYIIADQVELEDVTERTAAIGVEGPAASAVLTALEAPVPTEDFAHLPWGAWTVANITETGQPGVRFFGPADESASLIRHLEAVGARPAAAADARLVRLENGKPRYGEDILDTSLPQETQQTQAISFTKGCYLGQEIVERIRARGHVNRKLVRLFIDGSEPLKPGDKLIAENMEAGEVTSSAYSPESGKVVALAYVRVQYAGAGTTLAAGNVTAQVA